MIVANNLKQDGAGFGGNTNIVTLITKDDECQLEKMTKDEVAEKILISFESSRSRLCTGYETFHEDLMKNLINGS